MTIRVHSPFQPNEQLQNQINERVGKLQRFFDRIKLAEVFLQEAQQEKSKSESKEVTLKVYIMRRVLYVSERSKNFEQALLNASEKMRQQLKAYETEMKIF